MKTKMQWIGQPWRTGNIGRALVTIVLAAVPAVSMAQAATPTVYEKVALRLQYLNAQKDVLRADVARLTDDSYVNDAGAASMNTLLTHMSWIMCGNYAYSNYLGLIPEIQFFNKTGATNITLPLLSDTFKTSHILKASVVSGGGTSLSYRACIDVLPWTFLDRIGHVDDNDEWHRVTDSRFSALAPGSDSALRSMANPNVAREQGQLVGLTAESHSALRLGGNVLIGHESNADLAYMSRIFERLHDMSTLLPVSVADASSRLVQLFALLRTIVDTANPNTLFEEGGDYLGQLVDLLDEGGGVASAVVNELRSRASTVDIDDLTSVLDTMLEDPGIGVCDLYAEESVDDVGRPLVTHAESELNATLCTVFDELKSVYTALNPDGILAELDHVVGSDGVLQGAEEVFGGALSQVETLVDDLRSAIGLLEEGLRPFYTVFWDKLLHDYFNPLMSEVRSQVVSCATGTMCLGSGYDNAPDPKMWIETHSEKLDHCVSQSRHSWDSQESFDNKFLCGN